MQFIELERTFGPPEKEEDDYSYLLASRRFSGKKSWADLLEYSRVVVLASAGSGKTEEFKQKAKQLRKQGSLGLFFAIEELADQSVENCLSKSEEALLQYWQADSRVGYFFLDSVDEAKLRSKQHFTRALRRLKKLLGDHADRAHIYVSCRPSDWDHEADLRNIAEIFEHENEDANIDEAIVELTDEERERLLLEPILKAKDYSGSGERAKDTRAGPAPKSINDAIEVVALDPLDHEQQKRLATAVLEASPRRCLEDMQRQGLEPFAKRPSDLIKLCTYWKTHGKFGSLYEMTEHHISALLREDPNRSDQSALSDEEALEGAKRLALATVLTKQMSLVAPSYAGGVELQGSADPSKVLAEWPLAKRKALLCRGLFTPASFGRIRFQHRSIIEFLSAQQLRTMLADERARQRVESILFSKVFDVDTITPELRPTAAWLAQWDKSIRDRIARSEPMELLRHGDPRSLPLSTRKELLQSLCVKHKWGDVSQMRIDSRAVWAFASTELADEIREAWTSNEDWEFRSLLLAMIEQAKIASCVNLADEAVSSKCNRRALMFAGVDAILALEDNTRLQKISADLMSGALDVSHEDAAALSVQLYPEHLKTSELLTLIERAKPPKRSSVSGFSWRIVELFRRCPDRDMDEFLAGIAALAFREPHVKDWERVSQQYGYLTSHFGDIAQIALDRLKDPGASEGLVMLLAASERGKDRTSPTKHPTPLAQRLNSNAGLKQKLFWIDVDEVRRNEKRHDLDEHPWLRISVLFGQRYWSLSSEDEVWLKAAALDPSMSEYCRDTAYYLWLRIVKDSAQLDSRKTELLEAASGIALRQKWYDMETRPRKEAEWERKERLRQQAHESRERKRRGELTADWNAFAKRIRENPPKPDYTNGLSGASWNFVSNLSNWLAWNSDLPPERAPRTWRSLEGAFGEETAKLYYSHLKVFWRLIPPKRSVWRGNSCTSYISTRIAFAGIGAEADSDPDWAERLTPEEARVAGRHLSHADFGVPDWLPALLKHHSRVVLPELRAEFKREWCSSAQWPRTWLSYFADRNDPLDDDLGEIAISVMLNNSPKDPGRWDDGLKILRRVKLRPVQYRRVEKLAKYGLENNDKSAVELSRYLEILCFKDINLAYPAIEGALRNVDQACAETVIGKLFDGHHGHSLALDQLSNASAETLEKLVRLLYLHVNPNDDIHHEGTYTPNYRDYAEGARSTVFDALYNHGSQTAYDAMRRLARDPSITSNPNWFKVLSKRMLEGTAALVAWSETEVKEFVLGGDAPIKTPKQFFEHCKLILHSIVSDFSTSDATSKSVLVRAESEGEVRDWLLEQLMLRSKGRYSVFREPQVYAEKRPDLIVSSHSIDCQIAIELKHSDRGWSLLDYFHAIEDQLVGRYLKPENRRYGLMVISRHQKSRWLNSVAKKYICFGELISELRMRGQELQSSSPLAIGVDVIGIDCQ